MSIQIKSVNFLTEILQPFQLIRPASLLDFLLEIWDMDKTRPDHVKNDDGKKTVLSLDLCPLLYPLIDAN